VAEETKSNACQTGGTMHRPIRILAASCFALAAAASSAAAEAAQHDAFWKHVQDLCNATSNPKTLDKIEPHAEQIAATAEKEHRLWGGHKVDHTGRIYKFGLVESENEMEPGESSTVPLQKIGWWNVWRYLMVLAEANRIHLGFLRVTSIEGAIEARDPDKTGERHSDPYSALLGAIDQIGNAQQREAAKESVIRAAVADRPWSAVFISYVVHTAIGETAAKTAQQFAYSAIHIDYIHQAFEASKAEEQGQASPAIYRACPAHETMPRRGDLICFHREKPCEGLPARAIQNLIAFGDRPNETCKPISMSHCEVVTHVDKNTKKVYTIGGNVFNSVTERRMNLTASGLKFSSKQGEKDCGTAQPGAGDANATKEHCSFNNKDWFVILQMRPSSAKVISTVGE
jgi:hypothetical protein